jgi:hypothetical protein
MCKWKNNRREILIGNSSLFAAVDNKIIGSAIAQVHNTSWEEIKSVNSVAQRLQRTCSSFKAFCMSRIELNFRKVYFCYELHKWAGPLMKPYLCYGLR